MPISSQAVGSELPARTVPVTPQMTLAYAAGIGDESPPCVDDLWPDFIAHPAFCTRIEWLLVSQGRSGVLRLKPDEAIKAVHAGQDSRFLAPIRPGRDVRVSGRIAEVRSTGAGAVVRTQIDIADSETNEPLTSTISAAVYRGVSVEGEDKSLISAPQEITGETEPLLERVPIDLAPGFSQIYSACADIWNPIHTERRAALAAQLPGTIVHGTALWALAGRELIRRYAPGQPHRLRSLRGRFSAMVLAGDPIVVQHGAIDPLGVVRFSVLNASGEKAVSRGMAEFEF